MQLILEYVEFREALVIGGRRLGPLSGFRWDNQRLGKHTKHSWTLGFRKGVHAGFYSSKRVAKGVRIGIWLIAELKNHDSN